MIHSERMTMSMQTVRLLVFFLLLQFVCSISILSKQLARLACIGTLFLTPSPSMALTFPLQASLKNNYVLLHSCESRFDALNEVQTNPVKKLQQDNGLTDRGREQVLTHSLTYLLTHLTTYSLTHSLSVYALLMI